MEDGAAPNTLSKCCCVTKTKVDISSLPPKKKKKKIFVFRVLHLFRFVCLFGFVFPFLIFFRSFVEKFLLLVTFGSPHASSWTTRFSREKDDAGSSSFVVVGVFVFRFVCRANADGGDRHVFVVWLCSFTPYSSNERGKRRGWAPE